MLKSKGLRYGVAVVFSSVILIYLFLYISPDRVWSLLSVAHLPYIGVALVCYLGGNAFKALRFNYLIKDRSPSFVKMYYLNSKYNFYTSMIAGVGELSYPIMLKKMFGVSTGVGASSVVLTRIYDLLFLGMSFIFAVSILLSGKAMKISVVIAIGLCIFMIVLAYGSDHIAVLAARTVQLLFGGKDRKFINKVVASLNDMSVSLRSNKSLAVHMRLFLSTVPIWILVFFVFFFLFLAFNVNLTLVQVIFVGASVNLMGALPVKAIGGLGFLEAGLAGVLLLLGFEKYQAVSLGLLVRLLSFSYLFVLVAFASVAYRFFNNRSTKRSID